MKSTQLLREDARPLPQPAQRGHARGRRRGRRARRQPGLRRPHGDVHAGQGRPHRRHQVPDLRVRLGGRHLEHDDRARQGHDARRGARGHAQATSPTRSTACRRSRCTARTWPPTRCTTRSRTGAPASRLEPLAAEEIAAHRRRAAARARLTVIEDVGRLRRQGRLQARRRRLGARRQARARARQGRAPRPSSRSSSPRSRRGSSSSPSSTRSACPRSSSHEIKRSDVKVLYQSRLLSVRGEGEVEKVRIHDLDEDERVRAVRRRGRAARGVGVAGTPRMPATLT